MISLLKIIIKNKAKRVKFLYLYIEILASYLIKLSILYVTMEYKVYVIPKSLYNLYLIHNILYIREHGLI